MALLLMYSTSRLLRQSTPSTVEIWLYDAQSCVSVGATSSSFSSFLSLLRPRDRIFSLGMPLNGNMRSIWFVDRDKRLHGAGNRAREDCGRRGRARDDDGETNPSACTRTRRRPAERTRSWQACPGRRPDH